MTNYRRLPDWSNPEEVEAFVARVKAGGSSRVAEAQYRERNREKLREHARVYAKLDSTKERMRQQNRALKEKMIAYAGGKCNHCGGVFHPAAMDFHHRDPTKKEMIKIRNRRWDMIVGELDKCELLCANCHRAAHAQLNGYEWYDPRQD